MKCLKDLLNKPDVRGVVYTTDCETIEFHNPGVKDLFNLLATRPHTLEGAYVADRVIGRGAALLLVLGRVERVYAQIISTEACQVLHEAEIMIEYDKMVPNIINRDGTDICPVEKLTKTISQPDLAFKKIKEFLTTNNII